MGRVVRTRNGIGHSDLDSMIAKSRTRRKGKTDLIAKLPTTKSKPRKASSTKLMSPSAWREPQNPQATFLGLPSELRLQIYGYVFNSTLMHVHREEYGSCSGGEWRPPRFFWTACRAPHPDYPMLCANPKWSGLCEEEDRCTYRPDAPPQSSGAIALQRTCRTIYQETLEFSRRGTAISIQPKLFVPWLDHLEKVAPEQIKDLRYVTLAGPDNWQQPWHFSFQKLSRLKHLKGIAFQGQVGKWTLGQSNGLFARNDPAVSWRAWHMVNLVKQFPASMTVVLEGHIWNKNRPRWPTTSGMDEQMVVRIVRKGCDVDGTHSSWGDEDVEIGIRRSKLVAYKRTANWRKWWRSKDVKNFM